LQIFANKIFVQFFAVKIWAAVFFRKIFRKFFFQFFLKNLILQKNISKFSQISKNRKIRAVATFSTIFEKYFKINFREIFSDFLKFPANKIFVHKIFPCRFLLRFRRFFYLKIFLKKGKFFTKN